MPVQVTIAGLHLRGVVKFESPNTTLAKVLEQFCKQHKLAPSKYALKDSKGKNLDLTLPWRLLGLPNKTTLELVKSGSSSNGIANIAIQLPDGTRHQDKFKLSTTLYEIVLYWQEKLGTTLIGLHKPNKKNIDVFYATVITAIRKSYKTIEELKSTTLVHLGVAKNTSFLLKLNFEETDKPWDEIKKVFEDESYKQAAKKQKLETPPKQQEQNQPETLLEKKEIPPEKKEEVKEKQSEQVQEKAKEKMSEEKKKIEQTQPDIIVPMKNTVAADVKIFKGGASTYKFDDDDITDDMFTVTKDDLKYILSEQEKRKAGQEMLMTKKMREIEKQKKKRIYTKTLIRIRFPISHIVLQATFKPEHKLSKVYEFIQQCLKNPNVPFYLYVAPPVQRYEELDKSLEQLGLIPAVILNIGLDQKKAKKDDKLEIADEILKYTTELKSEIIPKNINKQKEEEEELKKKKLEKAKAKILGGRVLGSSSSGQSSSGSGKPSSKSSGKIPLWMQKIGK